MSVLNELTIDSNRSPAAGHRAWGGGRDESLQATAMPRHCGFFHMPPPEQRCACPPGWVDKYTRLRVEPEDSACWGERRNDGEWRAKRCGYYSVEGGEASGLNQTTVLP